MNHNGGFWHVFQEFFRSLFRRFEALGAQIHTRRGRYLVVGMPLLWFGIFFAAPLLIVLKISLSQQEIAQPPYQPLIHQPAPHVTVITLNTSNYHLLWNDFKAWFSEQQRDANAVSAAFDATSYDAGMAAGNASSGDASSPSALAFSASTPMEDPFSGSGLVPPDPADTRAAAATEVDRAASRADRDVLSADAGLQAPPSSAPADFESESGFATQVGSVANTEPLLIDPDAADLVTESIYAPAFINSLRLAGVSTLLALLIGFPMAYLIAKSPPRRRLVLLLLVVLPFWTSSLLRTYAWLGLLKDTGPLNAMLLALGVIDQPLRVLDTEWAIYIGMVYNYLPFMVLPLVANLVKLDPVLLEAAADLGAKPWRAFISVTLPLSLPGILAGCMLVFIPCIGEFVIPDLLGGGRVQTIGMTLWNEFFKNTDWPLASSIAIGMLMLIVLPLVVFEYIQSTRLNPASAGVRR